MKTAVATRDYDFIYNGILVKKFQKSHCYIMSESLLMDISLAAGSNLFAAVRDIDGNTYHKYNGEDLTNKTICIWRTGGFGDICFITPYFKYLKDHYPSCKIIFGCAGQYSDVIREHKLIDEFQELPIDTEILERSDFHLMFDGIIESNERAKEFNAYDLFGEFFNIKLNDEEKKPNLPINEENVKYFKELESRYIEEKDPIRVGIHVKTSSPVRDIPPDIWHGVVKRLLIGHPHICVYIFGSQDDAVIAAKIDIPPYGKGRVLPYYQAVRCFRDNVALVSNMDLIIGGDSSGLHMAAAFDKPMVGLFGSFRSDLRLKYYRNAVGIDTRVKCAPCFLHGSFSCDNSDVKGFGYCMRIFDHIQVVDEAMMLLAIAGKVEMNFLSEKAFAVTLTVMKEYFTTKVAETA